MNGRVGFAGVIILVIIFFCSLNCFEKKTTDPDSGRPGPPSNPSPASGAIDQPFDLTLSWSCIDPEDDPLTYDIYFGTLPIPLIRAENHYLSEYQVSYLNQGTTYYWRVVAEDDQDNMSHGEVWSFTTEGEDSGGDDDAWGEATRLFGAMHDPSVTADGQTMYMTNYNKLYVSNKSGEAWSTPTLLPYPVNDTMEYEFLSSPSITGDGNTLYFSKAFLYDSYWYTRKVGGSWQEPQLVPIDTTNLHLMHKLDISWDGSTLWFTAIVPGSQNIDIYFSTFNGSAWSAPQPFTAVNTAEYDELGMAMNAGGNAFYFTTEGRPEVPGTRSIWVSYKSWGSWQTPVPVEGLIDVPDYGQVSDPAISYDGSQLYFYASPEFWSSGIYVATAAR